MFWGRGNNNIQWEQPDAAASNLSDKCELLHKPVETADSQKTYYAGRSGHQESCAWGRDENHCSRRVSMKMIVAHRISMKIVVPDELL